MKLKLTLVKKEAGKSDYTFLEISQQLNAERYKIIYMAVITDEVYRRLKPFEGILYTEDSPGLLKNWIKIMEGQNDNKTFTINS